MADTTLYPSDDAYVYELYGDTNYGAANVLYTITRRTENRRSFLKFDISGLPSGAVITLAKLRLFCVGTYPLISGVTDAQARRVADDSWVEDEITWNNQPDYGNVEDTKEGETGLWIEWDVTSWVQNEWAGDKVVSICLRCVQESYNGSTRGNYWGSKEHDIWNPELYIEYTVPVKAKPSSIIPLMRVMDMISAVKPWRKRFPKLMPRNF